MNDKQKNLGLVVLVAILVAIVANAVMMLKNSPQERIENSPVLEVLSDAELQTGWYFGSETQKKAGTPSSWIFEEAGRSSCWHDTNVSCVIMPTTTPTVIGNKCPVNGWIDCMPSIGNEELRYECTPEFQEWAKENCPGFQGIAY
jgi:hypothetical protein